MNRREYIECLEQLLLVLPEEEREEAIQYYSDYFEDAGVENVIMVVFRISGYLELRETRTISHSTMNVV